MGRQLDSSDYLIEASVLERERQMHSLRMHLGTEATDLVKALISDALAEDRALNHAIQARQEAEISWLRSRVERLTSFIENHAAVER